MYSDETIERFWAKVQKTDTCWLWTASKRNKGYGAFAYMQGGVTVHDRAHRFSYRIHKGEIPEGMFILHTCDTPACVNPDHLFLGSSSDNIKDMLSKGRHIPGGTHCGEMGQWKRGESHHAARLNDNSVREIRKIYAEGGQTLSQIGTVFGVNPSAIYKIVRRKSWKHVV